MDGQTNIADYAHWAWAAGGGLLGRAMYHSRQVLDGKQKPFSWVLLFNLPIAIGMGFFGHGISDYFGLTGDPEIAVTIASGYLGPWAIDLLLGIWSSKISPGNGPRSHK